MSRLMSCDASASKLSDWTYDELKLLYVALLWLWLDIHTEKKGILATELMLRGMDTLH